MFSFLENQKGQAESYIKESGWRFGQPGPVTLATNRQHEPAAVTVET